MSALDPDEYLGKKVIVESRGHMKWTGVAVAFSKGPAVLIEQSTGHRLMLPAARVELADPPKPWHEAKPGEVWVLTVAGGLEQPWRRMESGRWLSCTTGMVEYNDEHAIAGRRIWPEVSDE